MATRKQHLPGDPRADAAPPPPPVTKSGNGGTFGTWGPQPDGGILYPDPPERSPALGQRVMATYRIPPGSRTRATDPWTVSIVEITGDADAAAFKAAGDDLMAYSAERAIRALYAINGKVIDAASEGQRVAWESCSQRVQQLIRKGVAKWHDIEAEESADFLDSESLSIP